MTMNKRIVLIIMILLLMFPAWGRNIISFEFDEYNVFIYYPDDYKKILMTNGVIFHSELYNSAFSMLVSESKSGVEEHLQFFEEQYNAENLIDSSEIFLNNEELAGFNVDNGARSYFKYEEDNEIVNKSLLVMRKDSIVYMIIAQFSGEIPAEEIAIVNDCISTFKAY